MSDVNIRVLRFYQKPVENKDGTLSVEDWCEYAPVGQADRLVIPEAIKRLSRVQKGASDNPAVNAANAIWDYIRPHYEMWKKGEELPVEGTPLAAANFIRAEYAEVLKRHGIRTVEEFDAMSETVSDKLQIPNIRALRAQAKRFLGAQDQNRVAADLKAKDEKIEALQEQMKDLMARLAAPNPEPDVATAPRRGRPPKVHADAED